MYATVSVIELVRGDRSPNGVSRAVQLELPHVLARRALGAGFERHARGHVLRLFLPHDVVHAVRGQRRGDGQQRRLVGYLRTRARAFR